jgi:hypothetical protein
MCGSQTYHGYTSNQAPMIDTAARYLRVFDGCGGNDRSLYNSSGHIYIFDRVLAPASL